MGTPLTTNASADPGTDEKSYSILRATGASISQARNKRGPKAFSWRPNQVSHDHERQLYNARIGELRNKEYPMLQDSIYLDHAGTTLPSKSLITRFSDALQTRLLANPHSASSSSPNYSYTMIEETRSKVLNLFNASPDDFEVVFVANATAAIKLVADAFSCHKDGFEYLYHRNAHTSLVGVRELANKSHCFQTVKEAESWIRMNDYQKSTNTSTLFSYPAQSNMNGARLPLDWPQKIRKSVPNRKVYTLLDVAALVSTSPLDLSDIQKAPDFISLSFYKMFGFPDVGALIVRKSSSHVFDQRRFFGGGTTEMIICDTDHWVARKPRLCNRLEDGTLPIRNLLALKIAIDVHEEIFGGFTQISKHTGWLAKSLYDQLSHMKHESGDSVCHLYVDPSSRYGKSTTQGATVTFNIRRSDGSWVGTSIVGRLAAERGILIRTGSLCNPAGMANALGFTPVGMRDAYANGFRCGQPDDMNTGAPQGMVRVSLGAMSTIEDVEIFVKFVRECFVDSAEFSGRDREKDMENDSKSSHMQTSSDGSESRQSDSFSAEKRTRISSKRKKRGLLSFLLRSCFPRRG